MSNPYQIAAMNSGTPQAEVEAIYKDVDARFGGWLKTDEAKWWQVCNRLGIKMDAPGVSKQGSGSKPSKRIDLRDLELCSDRDFVNVEGMVVGVTYNEESEGKLASYRVRIMDKSGVGAVTLRAKLPDQFEAFHAQNIAEGHYLTVNGGMVNIWEPEPGRKILSVSMTKATEWKLQKDFDPSNYFPSAGAEPLNDKQPAVVHGMVMSVKPVDSKVCHCGSNISRNDMVCYNNKHPVADMEALTSKPLTVLTVTDGNGFYDMFVDGKHEVTGQEVMAVGTWQTARNTLRPMWWNVKESAASTSLTQAKRDSAKSDLMRSLKQFKSLQRQVVMKRLSTALDGSEAEAKVALKELIDTGAVKDDGINVTVTQ